MTIKELSRRKFLKSASGLLLVPAFEIFVPKTRATNFLARPAAGGGGECGASPDISATAHNNEQGLIGGLNHWAGQANWQAPATKSICKIQFMLSLHTGDISAKNYYAIIWTRGGTTSALGAVLTNGTSQAVAGNNSWSQTVVDFNFVATYPQVTSGTFYHITCGLAAGTPDDASNYAKLRFHSTTDSISGTADNWEDDGAAPYPSRVLGATGDAYITITYFD